MDLKKITSRLKWLGLAPLCVLLMGLCPVDTLKETTQFLQGTLLQYHDKGTEANLLKRVEINVTNNGFCRYRKFYNNGKVHYAAFNVNRLKDIDYLGTVTTGQLWLYTEHDDVIVQTYNDKKGDQDATDTLMVIPLKGVDIDVLNKVSNNFRQLKKTLAGM